MDVLAVGELLIDFTPTKGEERPTFQENPGGAPCNMLAMAQAIGAQTAFIGKVGNDQFGKHLKSTLEEKSIGTSGLILSNDYPTTLAFVHLDHSGDRSFSFYRQNCADVMLTSEDVDYNLVDQAKCIHFGSLSFTDEPSRSTVLEILEYAKLKGKYISYDPNYRPALWSSDKTAIKGMQLGLKYANFLKVSDDEAVLLTGLDKIESAAAALLKDDITLVLITLGKEGCYYHTKQYQGYVKGYLSKVVDTTGAGDAFFGAVMGQIILEDYDKLSEDQLIHILKMGNAAASLVIEGFGGIPSIPTKEQVEDRFRIE